MTRFTPTTNQVRDAYTYDPEYEYHHPGDAGYHYANRAAFDRWLNKVQAEVWDEAMSTISHWQYRTENPYRTDDQ